MLLPMLLDCPSRFNRLIVAFLTLTLGVLTACKKRSARDEEREQKSLATLPYLGGAEVRPGDETKLGAVLHAREESHAQNILLDDWTRRQFVIVDRQGTIQLALKWPEEPADDQCWVGIREGDAFWVLCHHGIYKLDERSKILKAIMIDELYPDEESEFHHELVMDLQGNLLTLIGQRRKVKRADGVQRTIVDNLLVVLDREGRVLRTLSYFDMFGDRISEESWDKLDRDAQKHGFPAWFNTSADLLHANTIDIVDADGAFFPKGTLILTVKHVNLLAAVDPQTGKTLWAWTDGLDWPHGGAVVNGGRFVRVLDNGSHRGRTEIVTIDPASNERVHVHAPARAQLYTHWGGHVTDLDNGHWLITETARGRVVELDVQGDKILWEYYLPLLSAEQKDWMRGYWTESPDRKWDVAGREDVDVDIAEISVRAFCYRAIPI